MAVLATTVVGRWELQGDEVRRATLLGWRREGTVGTRGSPEASDYGGRNGGRAPFSLAAATLEVVGRTWDIRVKGESWVQANPGSKKCMFMWTVMIDLIHFHSINVYLSVYSPQ